MKVEIGIYNGSDNMATCTVSNASIGVRVLQEFIDFLRYEDADSICIKAKNLPVIIISFMSHIDIIVNGEVYAYPDGCDVATNMLAGLWEE